MDLGMDFLHWPSAAAVKTEKPTMRKGQPCDLLESRTPNRLELIPSSVLYTRESGGIISAEAFDQNNKVAKEFAVKKLPEGRKIVTS